MRYIHIYTDFENYSSALKGSPDVSLVHGLDNLVIFNNKYNEYEHKYLTFEVLTAGTIVWKGKGSQSLKTIEYKLNDGAWTSMTASASGVSINASVGDIIQFRGTNTAYSKDKNNYSAFYDGTATFNAYGNIMSLIYGDEYENKLKLTADWALSNVFNASNIVSAENLVMPAITLTADCYRAMFSHCSLMTSAPALPAMHLAERCYYYMFDYCTSLTKAPDLPAPTLVDSCYCGMFASGTPINYIKCLATDISASNSTWQWIGNTTGHVANSGTFLKAPGTTGWRIETEWNASLVGIPPGWTVLEYNELVEPVIACDGEEVSISCATPGATIYYNINRRRSFTEYVSPITITEDMIVQAYSVLDDQTSRTITRTCEYVHIDKYAASNKSVSTWTYNNQTVTTPYSVNYEDGHSANYAKGTFNFETTLTLTREQPTYLWFQHADQSATIYVDDVEVEKHWGGYGAFFVDITNYIHRGSNVIKVALKNNEGNNLAPANADFNFNATLGNVKLFTSPVLPAMKYGYDGFHVTSAVSSASATVNISTSVPIGASVTCTILDGSTQVYTYTESSTGEEQTFTTTIQNPHLWHGKIDPHLYTIKLDIYKDGELYHSFSRPYGLRYYSYAINQTVNGSPYTGFLLNGEPYLLRGCCMHDDIAGKANALDTTDYAQTFAVIQELGCNFLRLAHYPHPKETYDWCDQLGIIVQTEVPLVNILKSTQPEAYYTHLEGQYIDMVNQHYNHPCIMFWGLGNEFNAQMDDASFACTKLEQYRDVIKNLDTERLVGCVLNANSSNPRTTVGGADLDWYGCNLYVGWYSNTNSNNPTSAINTRLNNVQDRAIAYSEYGCGGTQNCHSETPSSTTNKGSGGARHDIEYMMWLHEGQIAAIKNFPQLIFTAEWQLFDIAVANRNEGYTVCLDGETTSTNDDLRRLNDKGLVERDHVTKKDTFYLYKAWWSSQSFVHICGKDYTKKTGRVIKCYTNDGSSLDLYVNNTFVETVAVTDNIATFTSANYSSGDIIRVDGEYASDTFTFA